MNMKKKILNYSDVKSGFTMVELSLTMAFVAVLLITIAVITSNIMTIYQKGLTIKAVNSVGRGLTDEFITGITSAPAVDTTSFKNIDLLLAILRTNSYMEYSVRVIIRIYGIHIMVKRLARLLRLSTKYAMMLAVRKT